MSTPTPTTAPPPVIPTGVRVASTLCWIVGAGTFLIALAVGIPGLSGPDASPLPLIINGCVGLAVCGAAMLIRRQRRIGVLVLVLAWATPTVIALFEKQPATGGPLLIIVALLLVGANWKHLR